VQYSIIYLHVFILTHQISLFYYLMAQGRGLRTLVSRSCTGFVSIPGGGITGFGADEDDSATQAGVDSLNVSVTGGILLWHFLSKLQQ